MSDILNARYEEMARTLEDTVRQFNTAAAMVVSDGRGKYLEDAFNHGMRAPTRVGISRFRAAWREYMKANGAR